MPTGNELIVTFHGLGEPPAGISADERNVWVPAEWLEALAAAAPARDVSFAFDDGNLSDIELALPILQRHGLTARFFVLAGRIGEPGYLSAADVNRLHEAGMTIGSHGIAHRDWRSLTDQELRGETVDSRAALSRVIATAVEEAACPFGSYDRRVLRALRAAGYGRVFTSDGGAGPTGAWLTPRTSVVASRPIEHWLELVARGAGERPDPAQRVKRLVKRLR